MNGPGATGRLWAAHLTRPDDAERGYPVRTLRLILRAVWCAPRYLLVALVWLYQKLLSPLYPPTCRYYPSCSVYSITALRRHGALAGTVLTVWRLLRCNPFTPGGVDDVPEHLWGRTGSDTTRSAAGPQGGKFCTHPVPDA